MSAFLDIATAEWVASNRLAFAIRDANPVSPGHTLVCTRRVTPDWFSATEDERRAVLELVEEVKRRLDQELRPDGYNVGFNAGEAAGQTVMHLHVHVIPRFRGDMDDPRGGVRHVIPSKANYLAHVSPHATGGAEDPFARHVVPLMDRAKEIAILAAFVQPSGLLRIQVPVDGAVRRGARVRILTGDYLDITQADALTTLLDWERASLANADEGAFAGRMEARVIEVAALVPPGTSFHPKSWWFESPVFGVAFVGSSNLSRSALETGIEWNLRVDRDRDAEAFRRIREAFEALWARARVLDAAWIDRYARRARERNLALPTGDAEPEPLAPPPKPREIQREALARLREARAAGRRRAVVVLATGLGKTWLAAFDLSQLQEELGRSPRLLFVAHRSEILRQAASTYRRQLRAMGEQARTGWFAGDADELSAHLVFASVAKLARPENLARLAGERFDHVVIDEMHHAAATSYRKIIDRLDAGFLLGLTATPDRADSADVLGLFDDFVAYRADVSRGIAAGQLTPFHYLGVKDDIDYENIPWRNRRFEPEALARAAQTEARMETLWRAWQGHAGRRTLVFCCSIAHADFVRAWLRERHVRVAAVYAAEGSDDREEALRDLESGELDAICAVDLFNEGVDVPSIDRVVMLRPTESSVVFLQQLGRGLRTAVDKDALTVIDFVGNHRVFLERLRALLSVGTGTDGPRALRDLLAGVELELPDGCSVDIELEAKQLLQRLFRVSGADEVERAYRELRLERGGEEDSALRPTAGELQRMGYLPDRLRDRHGGWFDFVRGEGDLSPVEEQAFERHADFLRDLETTEMTRSFKMVTLQVALEQGRLVQGMTVSELSGGAREILGRSPELLVDVTDDLREDITAPDPSPRWVAYWKRNSVAAWTEERKAGRAWFRLDGEVFRPAFDVEPAHREALAGLAREIVDYRLARYRARRAERVATAEGFVCKVLTNGRDPILKLPPRQAEVPRGEIDVRLVDGSVWQFRFMKEFCNVARPAGTQRNLLPDLMREWFGPRAGQAGTAYQVRFRAAPDGLWAEPEQAKVIELASRRKIVAYPDLRAAAGHVLDATEPPGDDLVALPVEEGSPDLFAVRVSGTSMDGGRDPLRDGDWAVMRVARSLPASAVENRIVLVETHDDSFGATYRIKRLQRDGRGWRFTSDNPDGPTFKAAEPMVAIARLERAIRPEDLAPPVGTVVGEDDLAERFANEGLAPAPTGSTDICSCSSRAPTCWSSPIAFESRRSCRDPPRRHTSSLAPGMDGAISGSGGRRRMPDSGPSRRWTSQPGARGVLVARCRGVCPRACWHVPRSTPTR